MKNGFLKVATASPAIRLADCEYNAEQITTVIQRAELENVKLLLLPELCLTGYTCGDLFLQDCLIHEARVKLCALAKKTKGMDVLTVVGLPVSVNSKLYNAAACIQNGKILGITAKKHLPNYSDCKELRYFAVPDETQQDLVWEDQTIPFGVRLLFQPKEIKDLRIGIEICEELWVPHSTSVSHALAGATVIANPSAGCAMAGRAAIRREKVKVQSEQLKAAYLYVNAGEGESSTDYVFSGQGLIAENGVLLSESKRYASDYISTEIDLELLNNERRTMSTFVPSTEGYRTILYSIPSLAGKDNLPELSLSRTIPTSPYLPQSEADKVAVLEEMIEIQCAGLRRRLSHIGTTKAIVGVSGGLDSTLALLVTARTFASMKLPMDGIIAVTMPCFGTSDRTYQNALSLIKELSATLREIRINEAVELHFRDIGHDPKVKNVTYENAQARERTQILMDIANDVNGIVIGTGDLSELALGFATYNGDHMSMYGVNASIPKTLMRHLVDYVAKTSESDRLKATLLDILNTPVSPELLPPMEGEISQKTEDLVGPYELHDFFLYYVMKYGFTPSKILRLAKKAFEGAFKEDEIRKWLKVFYRRFFSQQYKRSCLPDGPKVGILSLSPRGSWQMPSDACVQAWLRELGQ